MVMDGLEDGGKCLLHRHRPSVEIVQPNRIGGGGNDHLRPVYRRRDRDRTDCHGKIGRYGRGGCGGAESIEARRRRGCASCRQHAQHGPEPVRKAHGFSRRPRISDSGWRSMESASTRSARAAAVTSWSASRSCCWAGAFGPTSVVSALVARRSTAGTARRASSSVFCRSGSASLSTRGTSLLVSFLVWSRPCSAFFRSAPLDSSGNRSGLATTLARL